MTQAADYRLLTRYSELSMMHAPRVVPDWEGENHGTSTRMMKTAASTRMPGTAVNAISRPTGFNRPSAISTSAVESITTVRTNTATDRPRIPLVYDGPIRDEGHATEAAPSASTSAVTGPRSSTVSGR
jgi:hypothetical protein